MENVAVPCVFFRSIVYFPASVFCALDTVRDVMPLMVSTWNLRVSGNLPPLYCHLQSGSGHPVKGISMAADAPDFITRRSSYLWSPMTGATAKKEMNILPLKVRALISTVVVYLWFYQQTILFQSGDRLQTSESDVHSRKSKVDPRAEKVKGIIRS